MEILLLLMLYVYIENLNAIYLNYFYNYYRNIIYNNLLIFKYLLFIFINI